MNLRLTHFIVTAVVSLVPIPVAAQSIDTSISPIRHIHVQSLRSFTPAPRLTRVATTAYTVRAPGAPIRL